MASKFRSLFQSKSKESRSQSPHPPSTHEPSSTQTSPPHDRPTQLPLVPQTSPGPASIVTNSKPSPAPIGKGQNYGIQVLHDGGSGACVDIVFVHGLTGNAYNTWLHKETGILWPHKETEIHWPSGLLGQDLPDTRIMSFGYDADVVNFWNPASNSRLSSHAENLVGDLVRERERTDTEDRKILFVAHSLGGLVAEYALSHSRHAAEKHLHQIERCTAGMVFLGTYISDGISPVWYQSSVIHHFLRTCWELSLLLDSKIESCTTSLCTFWGRQVGPRVPLPVLNLGPDDKVFK